MSPQAPENRNDSSPKMHRRRRARERPAVESLAVDIAEAAEMVGVSYNTLWRAIRAGEFPAVRLRDRILVPRQAITMLFDAACASGELIETAAWTAEWVASTSNIAN